MYGFCAHHLLQNLRTSYGFTGKNITKPFNVAVRAYTKHEFDYHMRQLDKISSGIRKDLVSTPFIAFSYNPYIVVLLLELFLLTFLFCSHWYGI